MAKVGTGQLTVYDMNDVYQGATPPVSPSAGRLWLNTNDWFVYTYNGTEWILASPEHQNFRMELISSKGTQFRNGTVDTLLIANVYNGANDISLNLPNSYFVWTKKDNEGQLDVAWNNAHVNAGRIVGITSSDVEGKAVFECKVNIEFDSSGNPIIGDPPTGTPVLSEEVTLLGKWFPKTIGGVVRQSTLYNGSRIQATVYGTASVKANFDYSTQGFTSVPNIAVSIDGGSYTVMPLANTVTLATGLTKNTPHSIEIVYDGYYQADTVWTNTRALSFKNLEVDSRATVVKATNNKKNILFVGDGITSGMRAKSNSDYPVGASAISSFPYHVGKMLNANDYRASFGNTGINKTGNSGSPKIGDFVGFDALNVASNDSADIHTIVLMAGTADSTLDNATFKTHYQTLITKIRTYYATQRIYIVGLFVSGEKRNTQLAELAKTNAKVTHIDTSSWASTVTTTDGTHPNNAGAIIVGNKISEIMLIDGWESGGGMTPVNPTDPSNPTPIDPTLPTNPTPTDPNPEPTDPVPEVPVDPPTTPEVPVVPQPVLSKNYTTVGRWYAHTEGGETVTSTMFVGSKLQATVTGTTSVIGNFIFSTRAFSQAPMIEVCVNGGASTKMAMADSVSLVSGLTKTSTYTIEITFDSHYSYERLWADNKAFTIKNLEVDNGGIVTKPANTKKNILFVGDGLTSGIRAIDSSDNSTGNSAKFSFPRKVASQLNANEVRSSFMGAGLNKTGDAGVPKISDFVLNNYSGNAVGTDNIHTIIIMAGVSEDTLSANDFKTYYQALITKLRTKYTTQRIYIIGLLSGNKRSTELSALAIANTKVTHISSVDWSGYSLHGIYLNEAGATTIGKNIADAMVVDDWANGGGATPIPVEPEPPTQTNLWTGANSLQPLIVTWDSTTGNGRLLLAGTYTITFKAMSTSGSSVLNVYYDDKSYLNENITLGTTYQTYTYTFNTRPLEDNIPIWFNGANDIYIKDILLTSSTTGGQPVDPNPPPILEPVKSKNFTTIGRWYTETISSETMYSTVYAGSRLQTTVSGTTSVKANFHYTARAFSTAPMISVSINGGTPTRMSLAETVTLASGLSASTTYTVDITFESHAQTETLWNAKAITIKTIEADYGSTISKTVNTKNNILFIGDGITSGFKVLSNVATPDGGSSVSSYTRMVANSLGANDVKASFIGSGLTKTGSGNAPKVGDFVLNYNSGKVVGSEEVIHTIVLYVGEADSDIASATFKTAYQELITKLRTKYTTQRIYIVGLTNATNKRNNEMLELAIANTKVTHINTTSLTGMAYTEGVYPNTTGTSILSNFISQTMINDGWANGGGTLPPPVQSPVKSTNFTTVGRWYTETIDNATAYSTVFVGSRIQATVSGTTSIKANFHYTARSFTQAPIISVSINGGTATLINLADTVTLASGLAKGTTYTVDIVYDAHYHYENLWNAKSVTIKNIEVDYGGVVSKTANTKKNILFVGDSITSGIRAVNTSDNSTGNSAMKSYPKVVANTLDANDVRASFGGSGATKGGVGGSPKIEDFVLLNNAGKPISGDNIHTIVMLVGENDSQATESAYKTGYQAIITKLRTYYTTQRIYIVGLMNNLDKRNIVLGQLASSNANVTHIDTTLLSGMTFTDGIHPDVAGASKLAGFISNKMVIDGWSSGGGATPPPVTIPSNVWTENGKSANISPLPTGFGNTVPIPDSYAGTKFTVSFKAQSPTGATLNVHTENKNDFNQTITLTSTSTLYTFDFTVTHTTGGNLFRIHDVNSVGNISLTNIVIKKFGTESPPEEETPVTPPVTEGNLWTLGGKPTTLNPLPTGFGNTIDFPATYAGTTFTVSFKGHSPTNAVLNPHTEFKTDFNQTITLTSTPTLYTFDFTVTYGDAGNMFRFHDVRSVGNIVLTDIMVKVYGGTNPETPPVDPPPTNRTNLWSSAGKPTFYTPLPNNYSVRCDLLTANYNKVHKLTFKAVFTGTGTNPTIMVYTENKGAGINENPVITSTEREFSFQFTHAFNGTGQILYLNATVPTGINVKDIFLEIL